MKQDMVDQSKYIPSFSNRRSVLLHLQKAGYQISRSKLYEDFKKGLIRKQVDKTVLESEVRAYIIAGNLKRVDGSLEDLSDLQTQKSKEELKKLKEQVAKLQFEREKDQGKYIPRNEFESELAARAVVFDSGFRHAFNVKAREWIALVGGKPEKSADFLQALNEMLDEQLTSYATTRTFHVLFIDDDLKN